MKNFLSQIGRAQSGCICLAAFLLTAVPSHLPGADATTSAASASTNQAAANPANATLADPAAPSPSPKGESATPERRQGFEAFKLVYSRNIFDPNRLPSSGPARARAPRPKKVEGISLVGTLIYGQAAYAFFKGSDAKYQTALSLSNTVAGLTLIAIQPDGVKLRSTSNSVLELGLDKQLRRDDDGEWQLATSPVSYENTGASSGSGGSTSSRDSISTAGPTSGGSADDIIKRLMQKREQEINR